jgi:hypothetical protein
MESDEPTATLLVPMWESATWWTLMMPCAIHFDEAVVDWVWLPRTEPSLFMPGIGSGGRDIVPPCWPIMAVRVDFLAGADHPPDPPPGYVYSR